MHQQMAALAIIVVLAVAIGVSDAITCYSCDSRTSNNCLDPFSSSGVSTCTGATCTKAWGTGSGQTLVIRGCDAAAVEKDECVDVTASGVSAKGCVCRTSYCNDGAVLAPMYKSIVAVMTGAILAIIWVNRI